MKRSHLPARAAAAALALAFALTLALALAPAGPVIAQRNPHPAAAGALEGGPSSLPSGTATIRGVVVDASNPGDTRDLTVALYALQPDGTPGIGSTKTAGDGSFAFAGISNDASIVYLVGVHYAGVPYGERTSFTAGQNEIDLALPVERPISDGSGVRVAQSTIRIEALGSRLVVEEIHTVVNDQSGPVLVPEAERAGARAPFRARLPAGALDFQTSSFGDTGGFEQTGGTVSYWGPIYSGEQKLRFGYQLPVAPGTASVTFESRFPKGTGGVTVLTPELGGDATSEALSAGAPTEIDGRRYALLEGGAQAPGAGFRLTVRVPKTTNDASAISFGKAEIVAELDDTVLEVTHNLQIVVAPGAHVAGSPHGPLLHFELPLRAELVGLSSDATRLGARSAAQGIDVMGPLGPGTHDLAFRYRIPVDAGATSLDLRFPRTVPTLLLRTADTGVVIESDRLHRLRPQAIGTRTWMLREAFQVEPDEIVSVRFEPIDQRAASTLASVFFVLAAAGVVLFFVVGPLRHSRTARTPERDDRRGLAHERDLVYATIRDLEHDFETGKVAETDFERARQELRARAIELMRQEGNAAPARPQAAQVVTAPFEALAAATTGDFCPDCGGAVDPSWRFCSHCGRTVSLPAASDEPAA